MKKKKILFQAKAKLAKMLNLEFESVETNEGKTLYADGEIVAGTAIYELTDTGEYVPAGDGTYTAGDMVLVVQGGMVSSVNTEQEFAPGEQSELLEIVNEILNILKEQREEIDGLQDEVTELSTQLRKATGTSKGKQVGKNSFNRRSKEINFADQKMRNLIKNFK
ncbi:MAG: hypothetical protein LUH10_00475 [Tannerellaceae bacterium]|nr:hypothetical protein [Tannerellaceae bacterium]